MTTYRISEMTRQHAKHDMIDLHTELPPLAEPRTRMLFAFLNEQGSSKSYSELYTLVVSLVQLGMDTHDLIDTETERRSERDMRSRQLKVLAGDFFSAKFYQLLADAGQIEMISRISNAVCEVNRMKVNLYTRMRSLRLSAEDYFGYAVQLRSEMFQQFAGIMDGARSRVWPELLHGVGRCEVALDELERSGHEDKFEKGWAYWHVMQVGSEEEKQRLMYEKPDKGFILSLLHKYDIRAHLTAKVKQAADSVKAAAAKLESDKLERELTDIADSMLARLAGSMPALNETR
ncbi:heptaprenyl diphosphate synthase component 1 [Paenibacillus soyae]|uniref:Heptaprenyl diphosphate synthase component 1 n=1 Tax=Paenibacillus soyae TaxID=2969249 RepID=A0A9X2S914_9BACL|nr:heptaprenyl diphosphate synthase component 1 [Paenibacillus soyae]MCR2803018.1 heptaprenyl diphosphate synthase component 1 [Paenibacillus soyae]